MSMFCYQCEQAAQGTGCTAVGVCGKQPEVAALQDLLVYTLKGVAFWADKARAKGAKDAEIDRFNRHGHYLSTLRMPLGSLPCDIFYQGKYAVVGSLDGPDRSKGAPIYLYEDDRLVSTLLPKDELGLVNFKHVHNAVLRSWNGKLYVIAQSWNPGDFAVLEQVLLTACPWRARCRRAVARPPR